MRDPGSCLRHFTGIDGIGDPFFTMPPQFDGTDSIVNENTLPTGQPKEQ
jgi:hypothetical protein